MKYFLHDSNAFQDEKITELYMQFGYEGVGLFFTILEKLAAQEKPIKTTVLKQQLHVGKKLEKCWKFMETIGLVSSNNGETFNINLLNDSKKYQSKKEQTRERVAKFREKEALSPKHEEDVTRYNRVSNADKDNISKDNISNIKNCKKPKVVDSKEPTIYKRLTEYWLKVVHPDWDFSAAKGKALNAIIAKLKTRLEKQDKTPTDDLIFNAFKYICENLPDFFQDKDLLFIDSHFNELLTQIKNLNNGTKQPTPKQTVYDSAAFFRPK